MFCAENRQRDGEAQVGQGCNLVDAACPGDVVSCGQHTNRQQCEPGGGHRHGGTGKCEEYGENSLLHGLPNPYELLKFYDKVRFRIASRVLVRPLVSSNWALASDQQSGDIVNPLLRPHPASASAA